MVAITNPNSIFTIACRDRNIAISRSDPVIVQARGDLVIAVFPTDLVVTFCRVDDL